MPIPRIRQARYRLLIAQAGVTNGAGEAMEDNYSLEFSVLARDANRDRVVDTIDFILAATFSHSGRVFSQGNFDYDARGIVDIIEFNVLAGNFGDTLEDLVDSFARDAQPVAALSNRAAPAIVLGTRRHIGQAILEDEAEFEVLPVGDVARDRRGHAAGRRRSIRDVRSAEAGDLKAVDNRRERDVRRA